MNEITNFVFFKINDSKVNIDVLVEDETLWLTQKKIAELFSTTPQNITLHLKKIYKENELDDISTCKESLQVQKEGNREIQRKTKIYNLNAIIAVGYRVNSHRATEFRKWATTILEEYIIKGFTMDDERLKQIKYFDKDYFSEIIYTQADATKIYMGLKNWKKSPEGKILKSDVSIAKNYLNIEHLQQLERIVSAYLDLAENRAERGIVMNMKDWIKFLDKFLALSDYPILLHKGRISALEAKIKAESEYEKYRVMQDREYLSDFDKLLLEVK